MPFRRRSGFKRRRRPSIFRRRRTFGRRRTLFRRKNARFRGIRTGRRVGVLRGMRAGIPDKVFVKLRYTDTGVPTAALAQEPPFLARYIYRLSTPRDPDFYVGGNFAMGYPLYANVFLKYRVRAVKYAITWVNDTTDAYVLQVTPFMYNLAGVPPAPVPYNVTTHPERGFFENTSLQPYNRTMIHSGEGNKAVTFKRYFKLKNFIGSVAANYDESAYAADTSTDPPATNQVMLYMTWWTMNGLTTGTTAVPVGQYYTIRITYYTEFYQRKRVTMGSLAEVGAEDPVLDEGGAS